METHRRAVQHAKQYTKQEFLAEYPHPFLLIQIDRPEEAAEFKTIVAPRFVHEETPTAHETEGPIRTERAVPVEKRPGANEFSFITIGRAANNDIIVAVSSVSKCHAIITKVEDGYTIADARSKNGTALNGTSLAPDEARPVGSGDLVTLSKQVRLTFMDADAAYVWLRNIA